MSEHLASRRTMIYSSARAYNLGALLSIGLILGLGTQSSLAAPGDHPYTPPTGSLTVVGPDESYNWAAKNTAMRVHVRLVSPDDVDYINNTVVSGNYVNSSWNGGDKGSFVDPMHATDNLWQATGTGNTLIEVTMHDNTSNAEANDSDPVKYLTTVGGFTLDQATAHQLYGGNYTYSQITVVGSGNKTLYICPSNQYDLSAYTTPSTGPFRVLIRYNHVPYPAVLGDFSGANPVFGPVGSGETQLNHIGIDIDRNSTLDEVEELITLAVTRANPTDAVVYDQRTSPTALAEPLFPVVQYEHMEVGGTFYFTLQGAINDNSLIRYKLSGAGQLLKSGTGTSFSHTWTGAQTGSCYVRFDFDCNANGEYDFGESFVLSPIFKVQQKYPYTLNTKVSTAATGATQNAVAAYYTSNAAIALMRDTADDSRACIDIVLGTFATFTPNAATAPDPVYINTTTNPPINDAAIHYAAAQDVTIVQNAYISHPGGTNHLKGAEDPATGKILLNWTQKVAETLVHELGHRAGIEEHPDEEDPSFTDKDNLMGSGGWRNPGANKLTAGQADIFD